jgi:hypothetical protein
MSGVEVLQSVQFATVNGKRVAVINAEDWEVLIEWLENLEDINIERQAFMELKAAGNDRNKAGWMEWDKVKDQIE